MVFLGITLTCFVIEKSESNRDESTELDGTVVDMNGAHPPKADVDAVTTPRYHVQEVDPLTPNRLRPLTSHGKRETKLCPSTILASSSTLGNS
jgi:hypothetical protein